MTVLKNVIHYCTSQSQYHLWIKIYRQYQQGTRSSHHKNQMKLKIKKDNTRRPFWMYHMTWVLDLALKIVNIFFVLDHTSAGFMYRLNRLKTRASKFRRPPTKVYNIFYTVIGFSHLCCHSVLYFLNSLFVILLTQLHSISEYCRILSTPHHLCLYLTWLNTLPSSSSPESGELGGASQVE